MMDLVVVYVEGLPKTKKKELAGGKVIKDCIQLFGGKHLEVVVIAFFRRRAYSGQKRDDIRMCCCGI